MARLEPTSRSAAIPIHAAAAAHFGVARSNRLPLGRLCAPGTPALAPISAGGFSSNPNRSRAAIRSTRARCQYSRCQYVRCQYVRCQYVRARCAATRFGSAFAARFERAHSAAHLARAQRRAAVDRRSRACALRQKCALEPFFLDGRARVSVVAFACRAQRFPRHNATRCCTANRRSANRRSADGRAQIGRGARESWGCGTQINGPRHPATSALVPGAGGLSLDALTASNPSLPALAANLGAPVELARTENARTAPRTENALIAPRRAAPRVRPQLAGFSAAGARRNDADFSRLISLALAGARSNGAQPARATPLASARQTSAAISQSASAPVPAPLSAPVSARSAAAPAETVVAPLQSVVVLTSARARVAPRAVSRVRQASFAGEPAAPRVSRSSAGGARLARLSLDESDTALRSSRPAPGAPAFRNVRFGGDDDGDGARADGSRVEDLRSAVDDFRAAISDENTDAN